VLPDQTDVRVRLAPLININILVLSAAMVTVTGAHLAIALAREGGLGIIHRNKSPQDPAGNVDKVNPLAVEDDC
jgi:IMP dehydrogenase